MPSSRKQINIRPHPDDYQRIADIADQWGVPVSAALERLALRGLTDMPPILDSASTSVIQYSNSAS